MFGVSGGGGVGDGGLLGSPGFCRVFVLFSFFLFYFFAAFLATVAGSLASPTPTVFSYLEVSSLLVVLLPWQLPFGSSLVAVPWS